MNAMCNFSLDAPILISSVEMPYISLAFFISRLFRYLLTSFRSVSFMNRLGGGGDSSKFDEGLKSIHGGKILHTYFSRILARF